MNNEKHTTNTIELNLTHVSNEAVVQIGDKLGMSANDVINKIFYLLAGQPSGLGNDLAEACRTQLAELEAETVNLEYMPLKIQKMENYKEFISMMETLK